LIHGVSVGALLLSLLLNGQGLQVVVGYALCDYRLTIDEIG